MTDAEKLERVRQLLVRLQAEEARHKSCLRGFAELCIGEPTVGDHHASLHRARFIRDLLYALEGHMP